MDNDRKYIGQSNMPKENIINLIPIINIVKLRPSQALSLALFGSLWLSLALSGSLWLCLALSGSVWLCLASVLFHSQTPKLNLT